jgi:hypothetical protein
MAAPEMSTMAAPPSTTRTVPVIKDESSLARKLIIPEISCGAPILRSGTFEVK